MNAIRDKIRAGYPGLFEAGSFNPEIIARKKANVVKKNGLLEIVESGVRPESATGAQFHLAVRFV